MDSNDSSNKIESDRHIPTIDSDSVNRAVERSSRDKNFISNAVQQLRGLKFPAYGSQIIDYLRKNSADDEVLALYLSLNDTMLYRDQYHVTKAFEQNNLSTKQENQITYQTRTNLDVPKLIPSICVRTILRYLQPLQRITLVTFVVKHTKPQMTWSIIKSLNPKEDQTVETRRAKTSV
jgi:hypothetical protein